MQSAARDAHELYKIRDFLELRVDVPQFVLDNLAQHSLVNEIGSLALQLVSSSRDLIQVREKTLLLICEHFTVCDCDIKIVLKSLLLPFELSDL